MGNSSGHNNTLRIPSGKGPHQVGCTDLMVGHKVQGSFFRLYYPCQASVNPQLPDWVPCREYFNGLADFMNMNRTLSEKIFNYLFGSSKIPAAWNASFKPDGKYPVIIFSHGLGAFRTLYSAICVELASQGFIVAAVEHRDESASATFYFREHTESGTKKHVSCEIFKPVSENLEEEWMYYRGLKPGENEFPLRNKQVKQRSDECIRALNILFDINSGKSVENVFQSVFDLSTMENSMDLCRIAIMGHSFGGATVIECLCKEVKFKCGVALDTWMLPLDEEIFPSIKQPIFFINSEKFQWIGNIMRMKKLDSAVIPRKMITIRGTVHQSFPDFTFLTGNFIGRLMNLKGTIDPYIALDLSNKASLAFLQQHLGKQQDTNKCWCLNYGVKKNLLPSEFLVFLHFCHA
ncbi:Platelet-activating factor acetylhydrolase [Triplophysa tibetana]|uniref:Platelet-activating factor acetylhydrolase n=1 Tax=Triplophysa tibetana TaxID=1572043 RepID=A0A5A9NHQ8_9TELE|nr:Platelet-activating factor acetylhydrolase [Triplophysa tibetana]